MRVLALSAAFSVALAVPPATASVIFTDGFESRNLPAGAETFDALQGTTAVPGWLTGGAIGGGLRNPTGTGRFSQTDPLAPPAGGTTYAYARNLLGFLFGELQRGGGPIAAGATYTLTASVGRELAGGGLGWELRFYAGKPQTPGAQLLASANSASSGAVAPARGGWAENTLVWVADPLFVGRDLWVGLALRNNDLANFDNVTLSVALPPPPPPPAPVPAPGAVGLLALPLLGLAGALRLRAATKPA